MNERRNTGWDPQGRHVIECACPTVSKTLEKRLKLKARPSSGDEFFVHPTTWTSLWWCWIKARPARRGTTPARDQPPVPSTVPSPFSIRRTRHLPPSPALTNLGFVITLLFFASPMSLSISCFRKHFRIKCEIFVFFFNYICFRCMKVASSRSFGFLQSMVMLWHVFVRMEHCHYGRSLQKVLIIMCDSHAHFRTLSCCNKIYSLLMGKLSSLLLKLDSVYSKSLCSEHLMEHIELSSAYCSSQMQIP